ncbi:MAG: Ig-like domain-containing protein, partial [Bifidobacteriaceae bacterium]|nr:Ig-like domain-containing protein [Bifidobacteriaceae bacterium]
MTITRTARQYANHDAPGLDPDDWGVQTITVTLRDQNNSPYQDATAPGALIASAPANGSQGVHYGATTGTAGQFACAVEPVGGACPGGVYTLAVHAATAGDKPITVTYAAGGKTFTLSDAATGAGHVVASFATPPASAADSVFIFNGPGETAPQDDWDDPADEPDGVGVVHPAGHTFHPAIRVWDAGRNNPVEGASVRFRVDASCPASFTGVGVEAGAKTVLATTSDLGKAVVGLTSDAVAACQVHGELRQDGRWVALPGGDADPWVKTAEWRDAKVDLAASSFTVSTGDVVANGLDAGTVSVTLVGANSLPVTTAQGALAAYGPDGEGVSVGAFHHVGGGVYEAPLTGTKAGYKLISVEVGGEALAVAVGRNDTAHLVAGPAEADTSWLVQSDLKATADGLATVAVRVRAIDAHGNPATHGEVVFTIPAGVTAAGKTGPDTVAAAVSDGWARLDAASTTAGRYGVTAAIGGQAVTSVKTAAGADLAEDGLAWAEFTAGKASAEASALSIPTAGQDGLTTKLVGGAEKHRAEVLVRDSKLNPLVGGTAQVVFRYSYTDAAGRAQSGASAPVATDAEGVAAWEFSSQAAATWTVTARVVGGATDVAGSPATAAFRAGALDEAATLATFTVDGAAKKTDGVAYAAAQMRATDQFGNPIPQVELGFELDYPVGNGPLFDHAQTGARTATRVSGADGWVEARIYSLWPDDVLVRGRLGQAVTNPREVHFSSTPASAAKSSFAVAAKAGNAAYPQARADGQDAYLVTVTLRDTEGVPLNAATATVVMTPLDAPGATAVEAPVVSGQTGTGQAQVPLQTLRAGTWEVRVRLGQDEVGTAADPAVTAVPVEFVPGPASPAHSRLASPTGRAKADGAETQVVEALVEDANGNAVGGQAVTFAVPAGVTAHPAGGPPVDGPVELLIDTEPGDGAARLVLTSLKTGAFEVTARLAAGRITTGAPAVATFANADLSPARSEFDITTMPGAKTVVTQFHTARVVVRDASGNVYSESVPVAFAYRAQGAQQWIAGPTVNSSAGVAEWSDFTVSRAGVYEVRANLPTGQIPDAHTTKPAEFNPGPADPKASTFRATGGDVAADGQATHAATVEVRDSHGNLVSGQPVTFTLPETGPARFATATCQPTVCQVDSSDLGLAEVELVSGSPATAHLEAAFEAALVGQADLAFKVGAPDPAQSSWSVEPGGALTADGIRAFTATVTVRDAAGHPVPDAAVSFDLPAQVALSWAGAPLTDAQGQVAVLLTSEVAGVHTVKAKLGATAISPTQGRQVTFVAGDISEDPDQTFLTAPPSSAVADGQETQAVTATVRDAKGNPVTDAEVRFGFPAGASSTGPTTVPVDADGQAELVLVSTKAASYPVTAEARRAGDADWTAIKGGAPAAAVFTAGPVSPSHSRISKVEDGPLAADGLAAYTIKVELKDQHDNPRREAGTPVTVEFRLHRADGSAAADVAPVVRGLVTDVDGVATTAFATTRAGTWRAVGVIGSGTVGNSPVEAAFTPGAASAGASQFTVTSGNVLADGEARHRATVVAKDLNGNLVPGARVAFSVEAGAPGVGGPDLVPADGAAVAGADGVAHVDITSREAGSFQVSAVIDGATVAGAPRPVSFDSGAGDPAKSSYALTPDTAAAPTVSVTASGTAADAYALTVTVRSSAGLPVPGARVRLAGLDTAKVLIAEAGGVNGVTGDPASGAYGQHTWHLYSATAGTFEGRVALDTGADVWANIAPAPFALRFGADTADAQASWLTAPAGPVTADGATTAEVEAHVNDAHGNAVDTGQVEFSIPAGLTAVVGQEETVGGSGVAVSAPVRSGLAAVALKSTAAGVHHVSASIGGEAITLVMSADGLSELRRDGIVPVTFTAGRAVADHSSLTVPTAAGGATAVADGSAKHRAEATTRDAFGNPVGGAQVMFRYGPDEAHLTERTVASDPVSGVAAVEFASAEAATYQVSAYVAGSPVAGSPAQAAFVAGPFDPAATLASFEVQDSAAMATGRHPLWVRMRAQDAHGNPVAGITLGFAVTATGNGPVFTPLADGAKQAQGTSGDDGWVTAYLVSEFQGFYPVVGVSGADRTQPKTVTFNNDSASAGQSWFSVERGTANLGQPAIANGSDSYKVTINLRNRDGHPLNGVQALVRVTDQATGQVTEDTVTSSQVAGQSGTAEFFVRTVVAGAYWVNVELGGDDLAQPTAGSGSRAAEVLFTAGPPSSAKSYLVGPATGPAKADGNESQVVAAHLLDANSNPVTGQDVLFTVPAGTTATDLAEGAAPVDGPVFLAVKSDATGVAELTLVSRLKGVYQVRASAGGISLTRGSPAEAVFTNAALAAGESVFTVPTASAAKTVRREFHTPRVELFDASHNLYTDASAEVFFRWRLAGTSAWSAGRTVPSVDGVALWPSWTVSQAGDYEIQAWLESGQVGTTLTARFKVDQAAPEASQFSSSAGSVVLNDATAAHFAQVLVLDAVVGGNPVESVPVTFTVTGQAQIVGAPGNGQTIQRDSSDLGLSRVEIVDAAIGGEVVTVTALVGGLEVGSAELEFRPGAPDPARTTLDVRPTTPLGAAHAGVVADGADSWTAVVTVRDSAGRPVAKTDVTLAPTGPVRVVEPGPHTTNSSGQVTVTLVSAKAGRYAVGALLGSSTVTPAEAPVEFVPGPVSPVVSYLEGPAASAVANGQDPLTVRAYVLDARSNPLTGASVRFQVPAGLTVAGQVDGPEFFDALTDGSGRAELTLTTTRADVYEITAAARPDSQAEWTSIEKNSPSLATFVAGPISTLESQLGASPAGPLVVGGSPAAYQVYVELLDQFANPVHQAQVPIQYRFFYGAPQTDPGSYCRQAPDSLTQFGSALTDATGRATVPFTSTKAGPWYGCAFYAGDRIVGGSPVPLVFEANAADPVVSALEVSLNPVLADGASAHFARVAVTDTFGNPLGGQPVSFAIETGAAALVGPFVKGTTAATALVTSCAAGDEAAGLARCFVNGVFQPGLAAVELVSREPGTFLVSAKLGDLPVSGSPAAVSFTAGLADALKSSWAITPDTADAAAGATVSIPAGADPADSYALTVQVRSASDLPVAGAPVRLAGLPDAVTAVGSAGGSGGPGGSTEGVSGELDSDLPGGHTWLLHSLTAGEFQGQVEIWQDGGWAPVGGEFTVRFGPGPISPESTAATFETFDGSVANNLSDRSWARVVVTDVYGNPVPGVEVAFELPATWPGAAGTPVFTGADGAASGKKTVVTSCPAEPADPAQPSAECLVGGVHTPGLALVNMVSAHEGAFPVSARVGAGADGFAAGSGDVLFDGGAGEADASSFALAPTDAAAERVVADGVASYTLTATVNNRVGSALAPVAGACVAPRLADGLSVADPAASDGCPVGAYPTDAAGRAVLRIVSTRAGLASVGLDLGAEAVATEVGGSEYLVPALFTGGAPAGGRTELTSPADSARADDPAGLAVTATVRDAQGNLAACWDGARPVACQVEFSVPAGAWVPVEGGDGVVGPVRVVVDAGLVDYDAGAGAGDGGAGDAGVARLTLRGQAGSHAITATVDGQAAQVADGVDWAPAAAAAVVVFTDSTAPAGPVLDPSNGSSVGGSVSAEDLADAAAGELTVV